MDQETIAIYQKEYLTISMTFIYRQLEGISKKYKPIVLASKTQNIDLFPWEEIYTYQKGLFGKVESKINRTLNNKYAVLSSAQHNYYKKVLLKENVKMIHSHFGPSALEILPIAKELNIPLLVTFHGYDASSLLKNKVYTNQLKDLFSYANIITVSQNMGDELVKFGADNSQINVHYIGVPVEDFVFKKRKSIKTKTHNNEEIIFLQVSNFVEKKGHQYTIQAFKEFNKYYPNSILKLGGDGPLRNLIESMCEELDLKDNVQFLGKVVKKEVIKLMQESDVFLHHSVTSEDGDQEGIPTVIMEAMASGLIVISTYHSGIPELVKDGKNGFLVKEKNVSEYSKKMIGVLNLDNQIGLNASEFVSKNFNLGLQNQKLISIYEKIKR
ncbi:glycosyltransferase [Peribacillus phoenicis]|uniref:glycosyltransferase n=1 Tax=unclassified Peribacillus TaxID=2675266 RepID=UPI0039A2B6DD